LMMKVRLSGSICGLTRETVPRNLRHTLQHLFSPSGRLYFADISLGRAARLDQVVIDQSVARRNLMHQFANIHIAP
jgi:hypothetical protein